MFETIILGAVGSLLAALIITLWTGRNPIGKLQAFIVRRRLIKSIKSKYLQGFSTRRSKFLKSVLYYYRSEKDYPRTGFGAPFELLGQQHVDLKKFCGFLIPPLDNGRRDTDSLSEGISIAWGRYFDALGRKARAWQEASGMKHVARRIVLFDKFLVDYVLDDPNNAIERSHISVDGSLTMPDDSTEAARYAQHAIRASFHLATIHRFNQPHHDAVETIYVDKSLVRSDQYYDFGLYDFSGVKIVYLPHHMKNRTKTVVGDRVFINESLTQAQQIEEFEQDFEYLWENGTNLITQLRRSERDRNSTTQSKSGLRVFSYEDFQKMYFDPLLCIFQKRLNWTPPVE